MKAGRKNLRRVSEEDGLSLQEGHSIMQVVSLRGSNLIEVMDAKGVKSLALFPAKFQRSFWIKSGDVAYHDFDTIHTLLYYFTNKSQKKNILEACVPHANHFSYSIAHKHQTDSGLVMGKQYRLSKLMFVCFDCVGSFVVVDEGGRDKALESGSKIACIVSQVLFHNQVRSLEKSSEWPAIFKTKAVDDSKAHQQLPTSECEEDLSLDGEDDLPPLEANLNRSRPIELYSDSDSESAFKRTGNKSWLLQRS